MPEQAAAVGLPVCWPKTIRGDGQLVGSKFSHFASAAAIRVPPPRVGQANSERASERTNELLACWRCGRREKSGAGSGEQKHTSVSRLVAVARN